MKVYIDDAKFTVPFKNLIPGDCFTVPGQDNNLLMRVETYNDYINAVNLRTGELLYFRLDDQIFEEKDYVILKDE
jgi:hypothetical protein